MRLVVTIALVLTTLGQPGSADLVELDVVVVDRDNRPVLGLTRADFQIKEDGKPVEIKTFTPMTGAEGEAGRHMVLLLDDTSVPMNGTAVVQAIAQAILSRKHPADDVMVVRLNNDRDEPFGDLETALSRIAGYRAGAVPFQNRATVERALKVIASIARQIEPVEHQRKPIVCIGGPRVCNVLEPFPRGYSQIWRPWVDAIQAAARANVAVYATLPVAPGTPFVTAGGLVDMTGGSGFANNGPFDRFVSKVWDEATQYYLMGYWPADAKRELRSIDVKVARKGVRVRARTVR